MSRARLARVTQCPQGHAYDAENTRYGIERGKTRRYCKACNTVHQRRYNGYTGVGRWPSHTNDIRVR